MRKPKVQQRTERRISAALRLVMVAVLLLAQIALVVGLSDLLKQRMALAYTVLQLLAGVVAMRIWARPGATSYKMGWIILVLFVPVVGLILYLLWNGDRPSKRLSLKKPVPIEEPLAQQELARTNLEKLRQTAPQWYPVAAYLDRKGFPLYRNTQLHYLPTGEAYLDDMLTVLDTAQRFIFVEYFIMAEGQIWDRLSEILCRKSRQGVEVKLIFDDFGSMMRMPNEKVEELQEAGVEVKVFNPVHHYVNRLYFNYRDHRKITCVDGDVAYTGGANIADEYANLIERFGYWKDCGVRLEGEGAWGLTARFCRCGSAWAARCSTSTTTTARCTIPRRRASARRWWTAPTTIPTTRRRICFCSSSAGRGTPCISPRPIWPSTSLCSRRSAWPPTAAWTCASSCPASPTTSLPIWWRRVTSPS